MTEISPEDEGAFQAHLAARNASSLRLEAWLGIVFVPLFWLIDLSVMPEHAGTTLVIRGLCVAVAVLLLIYHRAARESFTRQSSNFAFAFTQLVAASISVMCWLHGGLESAYYAGLSLLVISVGFLFVWPWRRSAAFYLLTYAFYMLPLVTGALSIESPETVLTNQAFLLSIMVVTAVSQQFRFDLERSDFMARRSVHRARAELEVALEKLKKLDQAKNEFFGNLTHELRTPMTMILSPIEVMLDAGELSEAQSATLTLARRNALKLLKLINDLLDLSKLEERFLRLRLGSTDPVSMVQEIVDYSVDLAARKEIDVVLDADLEVPALDIDAEKIERVVVNLLSNALKFTGVGGTVRLGVRADGDAVLISVTDSGIGIAKHKQDEIFERFSQADASTTRKYGGTGIGLAFAKSIVDLHGGRISVESELGSGSTFTIHLKVGRDHYSPEVLDRRQRDKAAGAVRRSEDRGPSEWSREIIGRRDYRYQEIAEATERRLVTRGDDAGKTSKLLVVEDNVQLLQFIHSQLAEHHAVYVAPNGRKGLEIARREKPDLVITDYMMPEMDGVELVTSIRTDEELSATPIVMLTAKNGIEDRLAGRGAGADAYLAKPFDMAELLVVVGRLLDRKRERKAEVRTAKVKSLELISAGLAHEIHNPLSYVKNAHYIINEGALKILEAIDSDDTVSSELAAQLAKPVRRIEKMLDASDNGIERIEHIVSLIRTYAREGYPENGSPIRFDRLVEDVVRTAIAVPDGVTLDLDLDAVGACVNGLREELSQIVRNLVQNAVEAASDGAGEPDAPHVLAATAVVDGRLVFEVTDNGPGIPDDALDNVFTPFFSTKSKTEGMGLGLAIVHQIALTYRGTVTVGNLDEGGAQFRVSLPLSPHEAEPQSADP